jgi:membrane fusion protein (multidrug efflux system)
MTICRLILVLLLLIPSSSLAQKAATPVFVAPVQKLAFFDEVEALGTLKSRHNVNLTTTVTERITAINFEDNQRVKKGDVLVVMDTAEERAELAEERSRLENAQRQIERLEPLVQRGAASRSGLDDQRREMATAEARIQAIRSRINERRLVAPFDGVVGIRDISVGALAQPGTQIVTIDDDRVMKLDFAVPEVFLSTLKVGISIEAESKAYPDRFFTGTIASVNSRIDPLTRSIQARALLDNQDGLLKAGMLMRVLLQKEPRMALVIPEEALIVRGDETAVMVIVPGDPATGRRQVVEIGNRRKGEVEIISGLQEGQQVVTHGGLRLSPGAAVEVRAVDQGNQTLTELLDQTPAGAD